MRSAGCIDCGVSTLGSLWLHVPALVARAISVAAGVRSLIIGEISGQEQLVVFGVRIVTVGSVHASSSSLPSG